MGRGGGADLGVGRSVPRASFGRAASPAARPALQKPGARGSVEAAGEAVVAPAPAPLAAHTPLSPPPPAMASFEPRVFESWIGPAAATGKAYAFGSPTKSAGARPAGGRLDVAAATTRGPVPLTVVASATDSSVTDAIEGEWGARDAMLSAEAEAGDGAMRAQAGRAATGG